MGDFIGVKLVNSCHPFVKCQKLLTVGLMEGVTCSGCQGELAEYFVFALIEEALEKVGKLPISEIVWFPDLSAIHRPSSRFRRTVLRGLRLPIRLTVCFEAGRFTLTQSSWTASALRCSRKWMSGYAAKALVLPSDRGRFGTLTIYSLGEPILPSQGEFPFPLDFYLSWMSRNLPAGNHGRRLVPEKGSAASSRITPPWVR
jgi:hypothetical protein